MTEERAQQVLRQVIESGEHDDFLVAVLMDRLGVSRLVAGICIGSLTDRLTPEYLRGYRAGLLLERCDAPGPERHAERHQYLDGHITGKALRDALTRERPSATATPERQAEAFGVGGRGAQRVLEAVAGYGASRTEALIDSYGATGTVQ